MGFLDWLANLRFVYVLAIAVALYGIKAFFVRTSLLSDSRRKGWVETADSLLFAWVVVFIVLKPLFLQAFFIPSQSMEPTLSGHRAGELAPTGEPYRNSVHDRLLVLKLPYWYRGPQRGEIIVFKAPPNADQGGRSLDYIKRLIGLPGEKLEVRNGAVYINDRRLDEPYTYEPSRNDFGPIIVPKDHYFMMGDNRNCSADSRFWGPLHRDRIVGKAWFRFWPLDKIGFIGTPKYDGVPQENQPALGPLNLLQ